MRDRATHIALIQESGFRQVDTRRRDRVFRDSKPARFKQSGFVDTSIEVQRVGFAVGGLLGVLFLFFAFCLPFSIGYGVGLLLRFALQAAIGV